MEKVELAYIVHIKVWEDNPKVRADLEERLNKMCKLAFSNAEVADANDMGVV